MDIILQSSLPHDPFASRQLPGIQPLAMADWLIQDDAFGAQMRERDRLLATNRAEVLVLDETARAAADELLELVLSLAYPGAGSTVLRKDGIEVPIDRDDPLATLGHLVQEDLCILQKAGEEHVLTGAVLCFPAGWKLSEKFMRPLIGIHEPVADYDASIATRVQRMFNGVRAGHPLWRFNVLWYADPTLHQPRSANARRDDHGAKTGDYLRSERQSIVRLPKTDAVIFSIHTFVLHRSSTLTD